MTTVEKSKLVTSILALVEAQAKDEYEGQGILALAYLSLRTPMLAPSGLS